MTRRVSAAILLAPLLAVVPVAPAHGTTVTSQGSVTILSDVSQMGSAVRVGDFDEGPLGAGIDPVPVDVYSHLGLTFVVGALSDALPGVTTAGSAPTCSYFELLDFGGVNLFFPAPIGGGGQWSEPFPGSCGVATFSVPITRFGLTAGIGHAYITAWDANGDIIGQVFRDSADEAAFVGLDSGGVPIAMIAYGNDDLFAGDPYDVTGPGFISDEWMWAGPCGDGNVDPGEECDDGNLVNGDGCDNDCSPTCGDGVIFGSEECDDNNSISGDGCSDACDVEICYACANEPSVCVADAPGTPCLDGTVCNGEETCDGAGSCLAGTPLDCDDGTLCSRDSCDPIVGCINDDSPQTTCSEGFGKAFLMVKEKVVGKEKLVAKFLKGPALTQLDLGNPLAVNGTAYELCIYDAGGGLVDSLRVDRAGDTCNGKDCWKSLGMAPPSGKGYGYKDISETSDGVAKISLKGGEAGKSKALIKARNHQGHQVLGIALGLSGSTSAIIQLISSDAACLSASLTDVKKAESDFFKAK